MGTQTYVSQFCATYRGLGTSAGSLAVSKRRHRRRRLVVATATAVVVATATASGETESACARASTDGCTAVRQMRVFLERMHAWPEICARSLLYMTVCNRLCE